MTTLQWLAAAGRRVGLGLAYLARRGITWPWSTAEGGSRLGRLLGAAAGVWVALRVTGAMPWTRWMLVVGLLAWAYSVDARDQSRGNNVTPAPVAEPDEASAEDVNAAFRDAMLARLHALIGDGKGVHLDTLHRLLGLEGHLPPGTDLTTLRRKLTAVGIPVRDSVKVHGTVRIGVHRDDLVDHSPATSEEGPPDGVVGR